MKTLKVLLMSFLIMAMCVGLAEALWAQTRTLVTTLYITIKPQQPSIPGAPESVATALADPYANSQHQQFVKVDKLGIGGMDMPRYTMLEKL